MANFTITIPVGPIWNNDDAKTKCPIACAAHLGTWNGQWTTVIENEMSVCECVVSYPPAGSQSFKTNVPAGPIWSNEDAQTKGPIVAASYGGTWTGQWTTVLQGVMSVIEVEFKAG